MNLETLTHVDDLEDLRKIAINLLENSQSAQSEIHLCKSKIRHYKSEINVLNEQIRALTDRLYGRKSEKSPVNDGQMSLFDVQQPPALEHEQDDQTRIKGHARKKPVRKPLPDHLPRVDVEHDIKEDEKQCACGCLKSRIGQEVSEQLEYIPAKVRVIRNIRYKYACKNCEGSEDGEPAVTIARMPDQIIPKSFATPGLLAHILTGKFADALPFYRQEKQFKRIGVELPRSTMCHWAMKTADACDIILQMMQQVILKSPVINIDETTLRVLKAKGRFKCYMWVFRGTARGKPVLLYQYHPSRSGDVPAGFLKEYQGVVQTDGYAGYRFLKSKTDILHVGCWVHARRKFMEVTKAAGKNKKNPSGNAGTALKYISKLYKIEKQARQKSLSPDAILTLRQEVALPILKDFKKWLDIMVEKVPPKSLLGKAVNYTLNEWPRLSAYAQSGLVSLDNNQVENAIRPFVVGRKNWMFSCTPEGAQASAAMYSIIETARANGLEPYRYLKHLFENLPEAMTEQDFQALLPFNLDHDQITVPPF